MSNGELKLKIDFNKNLSYKIICDRNGVRGSNYLNKDEVFNVYYIPFINDLNIRGGMENILEAPMLYAYNELSGFYLNSRSYSNIRYKDTYLVIFINENGVALERIINPDGFTFKLENSFVYGYDLCTTSKKIKKILSDDSSKDELFKRINVEIDSLPKWMQLEAYKNKLQKIEDAKEKVMIKK